MIISEDLIHSVPKLWAKAVRRANRKRSVITVRRAGDTWEVKYPKKVPVPDATISSFQAAVGAHRRKVRRKSAPKV